MNGFAGKDGSEFLGCGPFSTFVSVTGGVAVLRQLRHYPVCMQDRWILSLASRTRPGAAAAAEKEEAAAAISNNKASRNHKQQVKASKPASSVCLSVYIQYVRKQQTSHLWLSQMSRLVTTHPHSFILSFSFAHSYLLSTVL